MFPTRKQVDFLKEQYPAGTRVELVRMEDRQAPPPGTLGTVQGVDDIGSLLVHWDSGSSLNVVYGEDFCKKVQQNVKKNKRISKQKDFELE